MTCAARTTGRLVSAPNGLPSLADGSFSLGRSVLGRWFLLAAIACSLFGCNDREPIRHYEVPKRDQLYASNHVEKAVAQVDQQGTGKPSSAARTTPTDRLLAAIVPHGGSTWYFKMTGPIDAVATLRDTFRKLIQSISFKDDKPTWTVPEGWTAKPGSGQRLATLTVNIDGQALKVSVIPLATSQSPDWLLDNVNRWRRQMGLEPTTRERLKTETEEIQIGEATATLVDLAGRFQGGMGSAGVRGSAALKPAASPKRARDSTPRFTMPDGWFAANRDSFSRIALGVRDGKQELRVTVSVLPGTAGGLLANFNRWRAQVGLPPIAQANFVKQAESLKVDGVAGPYLEAEGPAAQDTQRAIYGWIGVQSDRSWFVKLKGDAKLARQQRSAFRAFLKSLHFSATNGDGNGQ